MEHIHVLADLVGRLARISEAQLTEPSQLVPEGALVLGDAPLIVRRYYTLHAVCEEECRAFLKQEEAQRLAMQLNDARNARGPLNNNRDDPEVLTLCRKAQTRLAQHDVLYMRASSAKALLSAQIASSFSPNSDALWELANVYKGWVVAIPPLRPSY